MYGDFVLLDQSKKRLVGERIYFGDVDGRNETWLRDVLFTHPEIIPIDEIDSSFGPLLPLCKELRTDAGRIDAVFINDSGRLTIVECKLWRNPEARRQVVAQTLDYVSALTRWSYEDLSKRVGAALNKSGNVPFETARGRGGHALNESRFCELVGRSLREGRFLVLIAGDRFREGVQPLTELVDRHSTKAFSFGLVEVALYRFAKNQFAVLPRVLAKPEVIVRHVTVVNIRDTPVIIEEESTEGSLKERQSAQPIDKAHLKAWWEPVLNMKLDDQEQEPPFWLATNNVVLNTPFPGIQIKALAIVGDSQIGVFLSGTRSANVTMVQKYLKREKQALLERLPSGTDVRIGHRWPIMLLEFDLESDEEKQAWLIKSLNAFVNVLRPRLKKWYDESHR